VSSKARRREQRGARRRVQRAGRRDKGAVAVMWSRTACSEGRLRRKREAKQRRRRGRSGVRYFKDGGYGVRRTCKSGDSREGAVGS
jgi:hypothetical protein